MIEQETCWGLKIVCFLVFYFWLNFKVRVLQIFFASGDGFCLLFSYLAFLCTSIVNLSLLEES